MFSHILRHIRILKMECLLLFSCMCIFLYCLLSYIVALSLCFVSYLPLSHNIYPFRYIDSVAGFFSFCIHHSCIIHSFQFILCILFFSLRLFECEYVACFIFTLCTYLSFSVFVFFTSSYSEKHGSQANIAKTR